MPDGGWFLDDFDLSTLAWNVSNRSAGWGTAARRGENEVAAGRVGQVWRAKVPDANGGTLRMWVVGALPDGSMPTHQGLRAQALQNLEELAGRLTSGRLMELVRADDKDTFGRVNLAPNPSAESSTGLSVLAENRLVNPSGETVTGATVTRRNRVADPSMNSQQFQEVERTNLVRNPSMEDLGSEVEMRRNLVLNPSVEKTLNSWTVANGTIARVTRATTASGEFAMRMRKSGASNTIAGAAAARVVAGTTYAAGAQVRNGAGASRDFRVQIQWKNRNGGTISTSSGSIESVAAGASADLTVSAAAPANAVRAILRLVSASGAAGNDSFWDGMMLVKGSSVGVYFDGSTEENDGLFHRWTGTPHLSASVEYVRQATGWVAPVSSTLARASTMDAVSGATALRVDLAAGLATGQTLVQQRVPDACDVAAGVAVAGRISVKTLDTVPDGTAVSVALVPYDASGVALAVIETVTVTLDAGVWESVDVSGTTPTDTVKVALRVQTSGAWTSGWGIYVDAALVEQGTVVGAYFDGDDEPEAERTFAWTGTAHASVSQQIGASPRSWAPTYGQITRIPNYQEAAGGYATRLTVGATPTGSQILGLYAAATSVDPGRKHTLSARVRHSRAVGVRTRIRWSDGTDTTGSTVSLSAGAWTDVTATGVAPSAATGAVLYVEAVALGQIEDTLDVDRVLFESAASRAYFDGDTGPGYRWLGAPGKSESVCERDAVLGWMGYGTANPVVYSTTAGANHGTRSVECLASDSGTCGVTGGQTPVVGGQAYAFGIAGYDATARTFTAAITWYDEVGTEISTTQASTAVAAATWTRVPVTGTAPANAATAAVSAWAVGVAAEEVVRFDAAIFGFGASTTYADGASGSGWVWTGAAHRSASEQRGPGVDYWVNNNATIAQATTPSRGFPVRGTKYSLLTVTGDWPRIQAVREGVADESRVRIREGRTLTFAFDASPSVDAQFTVEFLPVRWNGLGWDQPGWADTVYAGGPVIATAAGATRVTAQCTIQPGQWSEYTHVVPQVYIRKPDGSALAIGATVNFDRMLLAYDMSTGSIPPAVRNLAVNPRMENVSGSVEVSRNLARNPNLETTTNDWGNYAGPGGAANVTWEPSGGFVGPSFRFLRMTWTASPSSQGGMYTWTGPATFQGPRPVSAGFWVRSNSPAKVACIIEFKDSANQFVGLEQGPVVTLVPGVWTRVKTEGAVCAAGTDFVNATVYAADGYVWPVGGYLDMDAAMIVREPSLPDYFDGATPSDATYSYQWTGTAHVTASQKMGLGVIDVGHNPAVPAAYRTPYQKVDPVEGKTARLRNYAAEMEEWGAIFMIHLSGEITQVKAGQPLTVLLRAKSNLASSGSAQIGVGLGRADGTNWVIQPQTLTLPTGQFQDLIVQGTAAIDGEAATLVYVSIPNAFNYDRDFEISEVLVAPMNTAAYFDGSTPDTSQYDYRWEGTPDDSPSIALPKGGYFDGDDADAQWLGAAHASSTRRLGPGRRALIEVPAGLDPESMAGGTRATVDVEYVMPDPFWQDLEEQQFSLPLAAGARLMLLALRGSTAPIEDATIVIQGAVTDLRLTDVASGAWVELSGEIKAGQKVTIDNDTWSVVDQSGKSVVARARHQGSPRWLPLTVAPGDMAPRLDVSGTVGRDAKLTITARRRFVIA